MKQVATLARRSVRRDTGRLFDRPAVGVVTTPEPFVPTASTGGHSIATTSILPGIASAPPTIQREKDDEGDHAPAPAPAAKTADAAPASVSSDAAGSTNLQEPPTVAFDVYHGATLQDVANALPEESGSLTFNIAAATDGDPITRATVTITQAMRLPKWAERDRQCKPVRAAWDSFSSALRQHEDGHVAINRKQLGSAHTRYGGRAASETQSVTAALEQETFAANDAFDARTGHGKTATPSTTIDFGAKCADAGASATGGEAQDPLQAKLEISQPGDPFEEEADRVADRVMRMLDPGAPPADIATGASLLQRACAACEEEGQEEKETRRAREPEQRTVQRKEAAGVPAADASSRVMEITRTAGQPLDAETRAFMEPRFGFDFGRVRVHADAPAAESATSINALAYTVGRDVVFAPGRYAPDSSAGRRLLAHELTHVVQQGAAPVSDSTTVQRQPAAARPAPGAEGLIQRDATPAGMTPNTAPACAVAPAPPAGAPAPPFTVLVPPQPKGDLIRHDITQVTFTDDPIYVRYQLEKYLSDKGLVNLTVFDTGLYTSIGQPATLAAPEKPPSDPSGDYMKRVMRIVREEMTKIKEAVPRFKTTFVQKGQSVADTILNDSKSRIEKQRERYGIESDAGTKILFWRVGDSHAMKENQDNDAVKKAAAALLEKYEIWHKAAEGAIAYSPVGLDGAPMPEPSDPKEHDAYIQKRAEAQDKEKAAVADYTKERLAKESEHPFLSAYQLDLNYFAGATGDKLRKLASTSSKDRAEALGLEMVTRLENIEKVRQDISKNGSRVWRLKSIFEATKEHPDVKNFPGLGENLGRTIALEEAGAAQADEELEAMAIGALAIAVAIIASAPTGGMSAAGAAGVAAAGVAEGGLAVALGIQAYKKFELEAAAAGTDYEKAKSISQDEPSLLWLALDVLAAIPAAKGGLKAASTLFKRISALRAEAMTLRAAALGADAAKVKGPRDEFERVARQLEEAGNESKPGNGKRLRDEVENGKGSRGTPTSDAPPATIPEEPPPGTVIVRGADNFPLSEIEAHEKYFVAINSNRGREYAVLRNRKTGSFAVVYGETSTVEAPLTGLYGDRLLRPTADWQFLAHYHPESVYFGNRLPSIKDLRGVFGEAQGGTRAVSEWIDWFDSAADKMRRTRYGYTPGEIKPFWVEFFNESGTLERQAFSGIEVGSSGLMDPAAAYDTWLQPRLNWSATGPPTVRTPVAPK